MMASRTELMQFRDRSQDNTKNGYEKREKRRRIRKLQDAISQNNVITVKDMLEEDFDVDFQYRGQTALQLAVREGFYDICELLIQKGANVNAADAEKNSLLNMACWRGYKNIAELLIQNSADVDFQNESLSTPLDACAYKGYADICSVLIKADCGIDLVNKHGQTALHTAVRQRHTHIIEKLARSKCDFDRIDEDLRTPLMIAAELGFMDVVITLLQNGVSLNNRDRLGRTAVYSAASQGHDDVVRELGRCGADVNMPTVKGVSPLLEAIHSNQLDSALALLDFQCNVDQTDKHQQAPIHAAIRQVSSVFGPDSDKAMEIVKKLMMKGCDINKADNQGWNPLYQSAFAGNVELTNILLDHKTDVNKKTNSGDSVLHAGAFGNSPIIVNMLIDAGCAVNDSNKKGEHPLFSAILSRVDLEIIKSLVKAGSNLNQRENTQHLTPLHEAAIQHYTEAALLLIESGCDINIKNGKNQTPLFTACELGNDKLVEHLLSRPGCVIEGDRPSTIPIHIAAVNNFSQIVQKLIDAGCDINVMNEHCMTPIMTASKDNSTRVAKVLLKNGCDLDAHAKVKKLMTCCLLHEDAHPHLDLEPLFFALTHRNVDLMALYIRCYRNPPYKVMKILSSILRTSRDLNTHINPEQKKEILKVLDESLKFPKMLQEICRGEIRDILGCNIKKKMDGLPVAKKLKEYLLMTDTFTCLDSEEEEGKHAGRFTFVGRHFPYEL